jgi:hypothetical protein
MAIRFIKETCIRNCSTSGPICEEDEKAEHLLVTKFYEKAICILKMASVKG